MVFFTPSPHLHSLRPSIDVDPQLLRDPLHAEPLLRRGPQAAHGALQRAEGLRLLGDQPREN